MKVTVQIPLPSKRVIIFENLCEVDAAYLAQRLEGARVIEKKQRSFVDLVRALNRGELDDRTP